MIKNIIQLFLLFIIPISTYGQSHLVNQSGNLVVANGFMVLNNSHFTNNATFSNTDGTVKMMGDAVDANTTIGGSSSSTFKNLEIDKSQNNVPLAQNSRVEGELTLAGGLLDLTNFDLTLLNTANAVVGATSTRYIKTSGTGQLKMTVGLAEAIFPIGNSSYNPAKISNAGTSDLLGLRVEDGVKAQLTTGATIESGTVNRVWQITEGVSGGSDLAINLAWLSAQELMDFDRNKTHFAHYNETKWVSKNDGAAMGSSSYNFTGTNISTLGAFSLGSVICAFNGPAILGVTPPTVAQAGLDATAICGEATMLAANTPTEGTGSWSLISGDNQQLLDDSSDPMSLFSGGIGQSYTLEWAVTVNNPICAVSKDEVLISFDADSDSDLVQDCADLCMGSDDAQNADGDMIPDGCDCLPNFINDIVVENGDPSLSGYLTTGVYAANQELTSTGKVFGLGNSSVEFKAGQCIELKPGFHAELGSEFLAHIELCEPSQSLLPDEPLAKVNLDPTVPSTSNIDFSVYPNPFSIKSKISINLTEATAVSVGVYNQEGRLIRRLLVNQYLESGNYQLGLNGEKLVDGLYYITLITKHTQLVKKVVAQKTGLQGSSLD